jgi:hypothetical protein
LADVKFGNGASIRHTFYLKTKRVFRG